MKDKEIYAFRQLLLGWYDKYQRDLPWRRSPTLYKTILSEFMLQQTQVATVLPYFERWLQRFPTIHDLASAEETEVLKHWEGLGYYNRARNLHRLAKSLDAQKKPPQSLPDWLKLPGIGPYTAAAITSIAQNLPNPVIDGNVVRVLSRLKADSTPFKSLADGQAHFLNFAQELIDPQRPGDYNQALMELGAIICKPRSPACLLCPVQSLCQATQREDLESFPKIIKRKTTQITLERLWIVQDNHIVLHQTSSESKRLAGIYELPLAEHLPKIKLPKEPIATRKRGISNQRITEKIYLIPQNPTITTNSPLKKIPLNALDEITLSGPHKKWISELLNKGYRQRNA